MATNTVESWTELNDHQTIEQIHSQVLYDSKELSLEQFDQFLSQTITILEQQEECMNTSNNNDKLKKLLEIIVIFATDYEEYRRLMVEKHVILYSLTLDTITKNPDYKNRNNNYDNYNNNPIDEDLLFLQLSVCLLFPNLNLPADNNTILSEMIKGDALEMDRLDRMIIELLLKQQCYTTMIHCNNRREIFDLFLRLYNRNELNSELTSQFCSYILKWEENESEKDGFSYLHLSDFHYLLDVKIREVEDAYSMPNHFSPQILVQLKEFILYFMYREDDVGYRREEIEECVRRFLRDQDDSRYTEHFFEWKERAHEILQALHSNGYKTSSSSKK